MLAYDASDAIHLSDGSGGIEPVSIFYCDPKKLTVCPCSERAVLDILPSDIEHLRGQASRSKHK